MLSFPDAPVVAPTRRSQHQLLFTSVYNKQVLLHLAPGATSGALIQLYEVDPAFSYKNQQAIQVKTFNGQSQLLQMQVVENLLVVHNLDE